MAKTTVVNNQDELCKVISQKESESYPKTELAAVSKSKSYLGGLHSPQISLMATNDSFSDRIPRLLTGGDGEETVLSRYDLTDNELEGCKQDILDDRILAAASSDRSPHDEVEDNNAAHKEVGTTHYATESEGPKA